jgi:hypothetical protein
MKEKRNAKTDNYFNDIKTIKDILLQVEENSFAEVWVFFFTGSLLMAGTVLHIIAHCVFGAGLSLVFYRMWAPVFIIIFLLWMLSFYRKMTFDSLPLFPKVLIKHGMTDVGILTGVGFLVYIIVKFGGYQHLPLSLIILMGISFLNYAQTTTMLIYPMSYIAIATGIILYFMEVGPDLQTMIGTAVMGAVLIGMGLIFRRKEKKNEQ